VTTITEKILTPIIAAMNDRILPMFVWASKSPKPTVLIVSKTYQKQLL